MPILLPFKLYNDKILLKGSVIMNVKEQCEKAISELIDLAKLKSGDIVIVGCSTSEVVGSKIGTDSNPDVAKEIFDGLYYPLKEKGVHLAVQCCEHLNRAVVVSRDAVFNAERVNVIPQKKAGGSLATISYQNIPNAIVVEQIKADAGLDIGDTFIGMHLKAVAVPVRLSFNSIGEAHLTCARTRPKFIGGVRAVYDQDLL